MTSHTSAYGRASLAIVPGTCWILKVDVLVLQCRGGNLHDTVAMAVRTALINTKLPVVELVKDPVTGEVVDFEVTADPNAVSVPGSVASFSGLISLSVKEARADEEGGEVAKPTDHFFKKAVRTECSCSSPGSVYAGMSINLTFWMLKCARGLTQPRRRAHTRVRTAAAATLTLGSRCGWTGEFPIAGLCLRSGQCNPYGPTPPLNAPEETAVGIAMVTKHVGVLSRRDDRGCCRHCVLAGFIFSVLPWCALTCVQCARRVLGLDLHCGRDRAGGMLHRCEARRCSQRRRVHLLHTSRQERRDQSSCDGGHAKNCATDRKRVVFTAERGRPRCRFFSSACA